MDLDHALQSIGDYGRGQILIFTIVCSIAQLPASWHIFAIVFLGATPDHLCSDPGDTQPRSPPVLNLTGDDVCEGNTSCEGGWIYSHQPYGTTVVTEWDLVCDKASLVELSQTVMMIGVMVGSITTGFLADRFGRKKVLFTGLFMQGIAGVAQAFSPSIAAFISIRFILGVFDQMYELPAYSMISELFTPRCRPYTSIGLLNFWAAGIFSLAFIAYFIRDWRHLQFVLSLPFLLFPVFYWVIPESPRWLLSVGRYEEASEVVNMIARLNGKEPPNFVFDGYKVPQRLAEVRAEEGKGQESYSDPKEEGEDLVAEMASTSREVQSVPISDIDMMPPVHVTENSGSDQAGYSTSYLGLFWGYKMSMVSITMSVLWFVTAFSYYGLSLNAGRLVGDPYLNVFLSGLVEIPSHLIATFCVVWFGRRWPICITLLTTCLACVAVVLIPVSTKSGTDLTVAIVSTAAFGKFSVAMSYAIACLYATEVFPTTLRNKGIAFVAITARVGALLAPFVLVLGEQNPNAPMILFGSVAVIPGMLVLLLPEMKGRHQPQTVEDLEAIFREDRLRRQSLKSGGDRNQEVTSETNQAFEPESGAVGGSVV